MWNLVPAGLWVAYFIVTTDVGYFQNLHRHGIQTRARVLSTSGPSGEDSLYSVAYKFDVGRQEVSGALQLPDIQDVEATIDSGVLITYNPANPAEYVVGPVTQTHVDDTRTHDIAISSLVLILYAAILLGLEAAWARTIRQLRHGIATAATVTGRAVVAGESETYSLTFQFQVPGESLIRSWKWRHVTKDVYDRCPEGAMLTALVLPERAHAPIAYYSFDNLVEINGMPGKAIVPYRQI